MIGAYEAISYGCGTSGGLAEGQATLGMGVLCAIIIELAYRKKRGVLRCILIVLFSVLALQSMDRKMIHTYYWWESDESNFWDSWQYSDIPALRGIRLSRETRELYENVCKDIKNNTVASDKILCFPRNPIFYVLTDRMDPGVYSKVQWFDVSAAKTLRCDWETIKENKPKVIVFMHTSENVMNAHEQLFYRNNRSETRIMSEKIIEFSEKNYEKLGAYKANNNEVDVFLLRD